MSKTPDSSPTEAAPTDVVGPTADGGMNVPPGMGALAGVLPSSMPPDMFEEAPPSAPVAIERAATPRVAPLKPASLPKMAAVKPASLPKMAAVKPASLPKMAAVKAPLENVVSAPAPAALPSSFPSSGKMLVFEVTSPKAPRQAEAVPSPALASEPSPPRGSAGSVTPTSLPPPSSMGAIIVTPARPTLEIAGTRTRGWSPLVRVLAVAAVACVVLAGRLLLTRSGSVAPNAAPASSAVQLAVGVDSAAATAVPATPGASASDPEPTQAVAPAAPQDKGLLSTSGSAPGRRIFVDDRTVGETPTAVLVPCGVHRVRVGSRGTTTTVDVPCGGEIVVGDR